MATVKLSAFLKERRTAYLDAVKAGKAKDWTVVMGNEAGDLDSITSAIAYAWYASKYQHVLAVSLTQTPRSELHLRAENLHAFELAQIDSNTDILCIDDVTALAEDEDAPFPSSTFALVDHNRLHPRFTHANPEARVVAAVDHHADEGLYRDTANPRRIVVPTGSCASLVAQLIEERLEALGSSSPDGEREEEIPPELATLLLCSILIDTGGLKPGGKAEAADHRAAKFLIPRVMHIEADSTAELQPDAIPSHLSTIPTTLIGDVNEGALHETPGLQELHATLQEKKASVAHLGTLDLLKRDYKEYTMVPAQTPSREIAVGLSSVPIGFASWLPRHADFWAETERFMQERGLTVLGVLTSFRDAEKPGKSGRGKHRREQMYVVRGDEDLAGALFDALEDAEELRLKRKRFPEFGVHNGFGDGFRARVWKQKNVDATRKVTAPLVKCIIEGRPGGASL
ncbi:DHH phosphoesterase [Daedaleopsis nitida]|nr:DHH phosphoesterase [Daedaleopsis nitida]